MTLVFVMKTCDKGPTTYKFSVCEHIVMHSHFHKGELILNPFQVPDACDCKRTFPRRE